MAATKKKAFTDEQVEEEIKRLLESPDVKLAKKAESVKNRRRQYMYSLRTLEKKGKELSKLGVTMNLLEEMERGCTDIGL